MTPAKAEKAKKEILFTQPDADVVTMKSNCDLMDLKEVRIIAGKCWVFNVVAEWRRKMGAT